VSSNPPRIYSLAETRTALDFHWLDPSPREWIRAITLLAITFLTTSYAGLYYSFGDIGFLASIRIFLHSPLLLIYGFPFSIPLITILLAHELGHYFACRYYGMRCTLPFFIPIPISITGTLGAFIKIKSPFPNKRALFDVGIAGPIAGFLVTLPTLCIGISLSRLVAKNVLPSGSLSFGEPLIFRLLAVLLLGYMPDRHEILAHPTAMAAWVGLLATSLNLLPIWQLDGGHIAYAVWGRLRQKRLSMVFVAFLILLSFWGWPTPSYLLFALLLLVVGMRLRFYHPPTLYDEENLNSGRLIAGLAAALILVLSFIPIPIAVK